MRLLQAVEAIERGVRGAAGGEGLVADLRHAEHAPEVVERRQNELAFDQREVAERPFERIARAIEARPCEVERGHRGARVGADLQRQAGRALEVGLHGAAQLAEQQAVGAAQRAGVEALEPRRARQRAQRAGHRRPEEAHR